MYKYKILEANKDFIFREQSVSNTKGSRDKRIIIDKKSGETGFFKYEKYDCSEACSEKLSYEIAKRLNKNAARIEFAKDEKGTLGIISYLFIKNNVTHTDAKDFFNANEFDRKKFCTINAIKSFLDKYGEKQFEQFLGIMVFDALIGETDRHEENWGLIKENNSYRLSPIYDSGCNLLRELKNKVNARKIYDGIINFDNYILKSKTCIYKENLKTRYKHFELIEELYNEYPNIIINEIKNLKRLSNKDIEKIVNKLPKNIIEEQHKDFIKKYLIKRRNILLKIIEKGE